MLSALQLISLPLNGIGYGMRPFASYNYGKGNANRLKEGIRDTTILAFLLRFADMVALLGLPLCLLLFILRQRGSRLFGEGIRAILPDGLNHVLRPNDFAEQQRRLGPSRRLIL